jgi:hypothetical protein
MTKTKLGKKMGMFDEIVVPKSYLKGLLTKQQEKLLTTAKDYGGSATGVVFQTKNLDNQLAVYKLYRQKLYKNERFEDDKWSAVDYTGEIYFWDGIKDKKGDYYWIEFRFVFLKGKVDSKSLEYFKVSKTAKQIKDENRKWEISKAKQDEYQKTLKYKFYFSIFKILSKLVNRVRSKLSPYEYEYGTIKPDELSG